MRLRKELDTGHRLVVYRGVGGRASSSACVSSCVSSCASEAIVVIMLVDCGKVLTVLGLRRIVWKARDGKGRTKNRRDGDLV